MSGKRTVLAIGGSDPSGGAGVQADLRTLADMGIDAISAITAITAQDEERVLSIHPTPADVLTQQLATACAGRDIAAIKIGMVATKSNVRAIAWFLRGVDADNIVLDPVLHSSSGASLLDADALPLFRQQLMPLATVITPNIPEASALAGMQVAGLDTMRRAAETIHRDVMKMRDRIVKPLAVIVKGGHLSGDAVDVLFDGEKYHSFSAQRIEGKSPRGTGCRFASAIASHLARGESVSAAVSRAKEYMAWYIEKAAG
ncbi:MAG: bifunctional hydroxymethylpyrimidine kinase/phosphomethylpyrimidine kinase [Proteobacteria bacterium]|nr:bifunctional hydroxymethylpyrimidine kinase/phosphomethylpyrimidine kinase [Pseudomonadota bacterium]